MNKNYNETLAAAIKEIGELDNKNKVRIHGKFYTMVQDRISIFRKHFGCDAQIDTTQTYEPNIVRSETTISIGGERVANGIAEEKRDSSAIHRTSAAEVAETSSIGRALANLSLHGGEYASANEVTTAIAQQKEKTDDIAKDKKTINKNLNGEGNNKVSPPTIPEELAIVLANFDAARHLGELQKKAGMHKEYLGSLDKNLYEHATLNYQANEERLTNGR
tara:strand:- start:271 stop:930 length:660 start_codon:yes stop_codon:yes gene_type:complete